MAVDKWCDDWPQDLIMVPVCIQTVINKTPQFVAQTWPYHNPWGGGGGALLSTLTPADLLLCGLDTLQNGLVNTQFLFTYLFPIFVKSL